MYIGVIHGFLELRFAVLWFSDAHIVPLFLLRNFQLGVRSIANPFSKSQSIWFSLEHKILKRIYLQILLIALILEISIANHFWILSSTAMLKDPSLKFYMQIFVANASTKYKRDRKYQFAVFALFVGFGLLCSPT